MSNARLDAPDDVEYTPASLIFRWHGPMLAVIVDLDDESEAASREVEDWAPGWPA